MCGLYTEQADSVYTQVEVSISLSKPLDQNPPCNVAVERLPHLLCKDSVTFPLYVTQSELMRLFAIEGDIKTDILNSTYCSISKEHFDTKTIFISYFYQKLGPIENLIWNCLITLKTNYQDMGVAKLLILYINLLKTLKGHWTSATSSPTFQKKLGFLYH